MSLNAEMLHTIKEHGVTKFISMIDIEKIEDLTLRIICRTIATSHEELVNVLVDRIHEDAAKASK